MLVPFLVLLVFGGLLLLAGLSIGRARGAEPGAGARALMAGMTGLAAGTLTLLTPALPLVLVPVALSVTLAIFWVRSRQWPLLGWFLVAGAGVWLPWEAWSAWNDLTDAAVSRPGWSPLPVAIAGAFAILGAIVLFAPRLGRGSDRFP